MAPKKFTALVLLFSLGIFMAPAFLVLLLDPFLFFHKPFFSRHILFEQNGRYQDAGLIHSLLADPQEKFDTVMLGTSMSENFPVDARTLKLTSSGARPREIAAIARAALATGRVKNVTWELFYGYAGADPQEVHPQAPLPLFLYDDNRWNDLQYVFNINVVEKSLKILLGIRKHRVPREELYRWTLEDKFAEFSSQENLRALHEQFKTIGYIGAVPANSEMQNFPNITENLLPFLQAHPEIHFDLFFPPVSYYDYAKKGDAQFWREMQMRRFLLQSTAPLQNVTVYGFDLVDGIGNDLHVYKDSEHYRPWVNAMMLKSMARHEHVLRLQGWSSYQETLVRRINRFIDKMKRNG